MATRKKTTKKPGPAPTGKGTPLQVRVSDDLLAAIDRERHRLDNENPGGTPTSRADVLRRCAGHMLLSRKG
jgi:hypothetical protein